MKISELCKKANVSKELVRHYESVGLLYSSEVQAGSRFYREFSIDCLERIKMIQLGKRLGLKLKEIKPLLDAYMGDELDYAEALQVLENQYVKVEEQIKQALEVQALIKYKIQVVKGRINTP